MSQEEFREVHSSLVNYFSTSVCWKYITQSCSIYPQQLREYTVRHRKSTFPWFFKYHRNHFPVLFRLSLRRRWKCWTATLQCVGDIGGFVMGPWKICAFLLHPQRTDGSLLTWKRAKYANSGKRGIFYSEPSATTFCIAFILFDEVMSRIFQGLRW